MFESVSCVLCIRHDCKEVGAGVPTANIISKLAAAAAYIDCFGLKWLQDRILNKTPEVYNMLDSRLGSKLSTIDVCNLWMLRVLFHPQQRHGECTDSLFVAMKGHAAGSRNESKEGATRQTR